MMYRHCPLHDAKNLLIDEDIHIISVCISNEGNTPWLVCKELEFENDYDEVFDESFGQSLRRDLGVKKEYEKDYLIEENDINSFLSTLDFDISKMSMGDTIERYLFHLIRVDGDVEFVVLDFNGKPIKVKELTTDKIRDLIHKHGIYEWSEQPVNALYM